MSEFNYLNEKDELEDAMTLNLKKILCSILSRKNLIIKVFITVFLICILSTFILPKKYKVSADLYINKSNNSNMAEINPYFINEMGEISVGSISDKIIMNEMELMQSPLVLDKVIKENNLRFKKLFGIFPTVKTGEYLTADKLLKKKIKFENKKGTNVVTISYSGKDKGELYNVVSSIITNYIELHKELNSEKSKSDKKIIESEYQKAKADLNKRVNNASGLPTTSMAGTGNLAAMGAFSRSAQNAMANLRSQYIAGERARVEISEDAGKVSQLATKLEWARLVEEMSNSSKVLILKEPKPLRDWENYSPKLFINFVLGIILGFIVSFFVIIVKELTDKKLTYMQLEEHIIYNLDKEFNALYTDLISYSDEKIGFIFFEEISKATYDKFKDFMNIIPIKASISRTFKDSLKDIDNVVIFASIGKTDSEQYQFIKKLMTNLKKNILYEVLV